MSGDVDCVVEAYDGEFEVGGGSRDGDGVGNVYRVGYALALVAVLMIANIRITLTTERLIACVLVSARSCS